MQVDIKPFAIFLITRLVKGGVLANNANGTWTLIQPFMGYQADTAFHSEQELVDKIVNASVTQYSQSSGLKSAS
jgi:predicted transcriptional regulator